MLHPLRIFLHAATGGRGRAVVSVLGCGSADAARVGERDLFSKCAILDGERMGERWARTPPRERNGLSGPS
jgi:hypothetical protein